VRFVNPGSQRTDVRQRPRIVRGRLVSHGEEKRADYILYPKPNIPIAIIEAKDNSHAMGNEMQQARSTAGYGGAFYICQAVILIREGKRTI
jgi:type I site-specific restriction endonuclease